MEATQHQEIQQVAEPKKRRPWWKKILRFIFWTGGLAVVFVGLLGAMAFIFEDEIKGYVTGELNTHLNTTIIVQPEDINLTFIRDFPLASVEFTKVTALDATKDKERDTLFSAGEVSFSFSILDIFRENYTIRNISLEDGMVDVRIDENGNDNYHFLKSDSTSTSSDSSQVAFALEEIKFINVDLRYNDAPSQSNYALHINDLLFAGDFAKGEFDLESEADFLIEELKQKDVSLFKGNNGHLSLGMNINTHTGLYFISKGELQIADFLLELSGSVQDRKNNYLLDVLVKGKDADINSALSLASDSLKKDLAGIETTGEFYFESTIKGMSGDTSEPAIEAKFGIRDGATLKRKNSNVTLQNISLKGLYSNAGKSEILELSNFSASTNKSRFSGSFSMKGNKNPVYTTEINGNVDLAEMQQILELDSVKTATGKVDIHFEASGKRSGNKALTAADFRKFKTSGKASMQNVSVAFVNSTAAADSLNGELEFDGNNVNIKEVSGNAAGSDFVINGTLRNLLGYLFTEKEILNVEGDFVSRKLDLNTLLASDEKSGADTNYVFALPANVRMKLNTTVKEIQFRRFTASSFTGVFELRNRQLHLNDLNMRTLDGVVSGSGIVDATRDDSLLISFNSKIAQVNISKLFYTFENFGQKEGEETIGDKNVFGSLTANVEFVSMWDNKLNINEKKLFTFADITIDQGELKEFKPLESLSRFINIEELRDIKFSTLHNTIEIRDRVVNIPRMEIKSSAVDVIMSGTHDFDNMVDYHFVVSLDELRARKAKTKKENNEFGEVESDGNKRYKLYISMKGPVDNPEIKYLDAKGFIEQKKEELKQEKQNLKNILREEFGWFKKDTTKKDEEPEDEPVNPEGGTIKFKKGKDEEEAPEGEDF